jgi:hypothetical protein
LERWVSFAAAGSDLGRFQTKDIISERRAQARLFSCGEFLLWTACSLLPLSVASLLARHYPQTSLNDLEFAEGASKFSSSELTVF